MVNIDNHFQILTIQEVINIKNFLNLKGKNKLIIFVPLWACIDTCDVVLGFECFSLYSADSVAPKEVDWWTLMVSTMACGGNKPWASRTFSANFGGFSSWSQWFWNSLEILSKLTPSLLSFIAEKIWTFLWNFASGPKPNRASFWGNNLGFLLVMKNTLIWYIYCLCLVTFWKSHFSRRNYQLKLSRFAFRVN